MKSAITVHIKKMLFENINTVPSCGSIWEQLQEFLNNVNSPYRNDTTLSKYVWDIKEKYNETPVLELYIGRTVPSYTNVAKMCFLFL